MRNKTDDLRTANGKSKNVPKKRNSSCLKTIATDPDINQTLVDLKRRKIKSSKTTPSSSGAPDDSPTSRKTKKFIGRFFYETGLNIDAVSSPAFRRMISHFSENTNRPIEIPTHRELKGWIFDDAMGEILEYLDRNRTSWTETGCTILLDGWTDKTGRELVNVLVESPKGTVYLRSSDISHCIDNTDAMLTFLDNILEEVGPANVVQIMTYSISSFMKEVGRKLMERHRSIFWTVDSSCCIKLMLEKMKSMSPVKETLDRMRIVVNFINGNPNARKLLGKFIEQSSPSWMEPFTTLENLCSKVEKVKSIFLSPDSDFSSTESGKRVASLIGDRSFWSGVKTTLRAAMPLVKVVEWMDKNRKDQIGYIYETIDQVKESIRKELGEKRCEYKRFWKVIDEVWSGFLYSPLHAGGYFFNPNLFYSEDVCVDPEVATGLVCCVVRAEENVRIKDRILIQIEKYRFGAGGFQLGCADGGFDVSPVEWWSDYGSDCPELQRLAIRILGQTCQGASKFQLERSLAERLFTKGSSKEERKKMTDMVFLRYNMHLKNFASGGMTGDDDDDISTASDDINEIDDRLGDRAGDNMSENDDMARVALDDGSTTERAGKSSDVSCVVPKKEIE
ncbi:hAT transposon superfamily protein [Striga asiatica]|uniref:HAT transposon superfamily protein n=1 Tax=Striga asiatica TaxID=4170 RepID=A0A5A7R4I6_STRAF|nr:hAT transposon superfamily protein [Striga asiatica]